MGVAYLTPPTAGAELVNEPMDFAGKNHISLVDLQDLLVMLTRPDAMPSRAAALGLDEAQRSFLLEAMSQLPPASDNPRCASKLQSASPFVLLDRRSV